MQLTPSTFLLLRSTLRPLDFRGCPFRDYLPQGPKSRLPSGLRFRARAARAPHQNPAVHHQITWSVTAAASVSDASPGIDIQSSADHSYGVTASFQRPRTTQPRCWGWIMWLTPSGGWVQSMVVPIVNGTHHEKFKVEWGLGVVFTVNTTDNGS